MQNFHPLFVHFPIALILSALLLDLLGLICHRPGLHRVALWNLSLGTLGAGAAVLTGLQAEEMAKHSFEIWKVLELHERLGIATLILGVIVVGGRWWMRNQLSTPARLLMTLGTLTMACTVGTGAYLGGRLVYEFGVGGIFGVAP